MPFTGYPLPANFTNATPVKNVHAAAHNNTNNAVNNLQDQIIAAGGGSALGETFVQGTPSTLWAITHSLSYTPNVTVFDSAGNVVEPDIKYILPLSTKQIQVISTSAFAGTAVLS